MAPRLVRRRPLFQRVQAYLNPLDVVTRISEKVDCDDWDQWQTRWATPICIVLNVTFILARANCGPSKGTRKDDVFLEDIRYPGWLTLLGPLLTYLLTTLCVTNTIYTFSRRRYYRLFENALDAHPSTPSAYRVRVSPSPPHRSLYRILTGAGNSSQKHPDTGRDVWELAVWDPKAFSLKMFCCLSPGHALVYWIFLPAVPEDPRPIVTAVTTIALAILLSVQLKMFQIFYTQQMKDTAIIHREVLNEYDIKYVHPRTKPKVRDVGTQLSMPGEDTQSLPEGIDDYGSVDTYTPTTILNKGFRIHPNPTYIKLLDTEVPSQRMKASHDDSNIVPLNETPTHQSSTLSRPSTLIRPFHSRSIRMGDGGSLGVYSHVQSPLRKAASNNFAGEHRHDDRSTNPLKRESITVKRAGMHGVRGIIK